MNQTQKPTPSQENNIFTDISTLTTDTLKSHFLTSHSLDEIPPEFNDFFSALSSFLFNLQQIHQMTDGDATDQNIITILAKAPDGLSIFENLAESRAKLWSSCVSFFLLFLEDMQDFEKAKAISNSQSFEEILKSFNSDIEINDEFRNAANELFSFLSKEQQSSIFEMVKNALVCQLSGLNEQSNLLIETLMKELLVYKNQYSSFIKESILKTKGQLEKQKISAIKGGNKRQEPAMKTKQEAIELFLSKNGYTHYTQAAEELFEDIVEIGKKHGFQFNSTLNGLRKVTDWFRETKRFKKQTTTTK